MQQVQRTDWQQQQQQQVLSTFLLQAAGVPTEQSKARPRGAACLQCAGCSLGTGASVIVKD